MNFNALRKNPRSTAMAVAFTGFAILDAVHGTGVAAIASASCATLWWLFAFDEEK